MSRYRRITAGLARLFIDNGRGLGDGFISPGTPGAEKKFKFFSVFSSLVLTLHRF